MHRLNQKIRAGVLWNLASIFLTRGSTTLFTLFLARLLAPEAFGLVAMATVVFEFANVFVNSGLGQALIRSKSISNIDLNTVFYTNLALSIVAYVALFFSAPYIADFYKHQELTDLIQVMALIVLINATKVVQTAVLSRRMNFRSQMKANSLGALGSGVLGVLAAYLGWGVWSLVVMMLSQALITASILWLSSNWRPAVVFSVESFSRLFRFGRNLLAEGVLTVLFQNSYVLVIGRVFSAEVTGLYFFAKKINDLISQQLTGAVQQATFPALSTLQDDDDALRLKYRKIMQLMIFLTAPIMALIAGSASPFFSLFLDGRWHSAIPYLQVLCIVGALYPMHALNVNLLNVKGRSDLVFKIGLIKRTVNISLLLVAIPYGVMGIVVSQAVGSLLALIPNTYFSYRLVGYALKEQILDASKPMFSAVLAGSCVLWLSEQAETYSITWLVLVTALGFIVYMIVGFLSRAEGASICLRKAREYILNRISRQLGK